MRVQNRLQKNSALRASGIVIATVVLSNALMAQSLTWLGTLGGDRSVARGVSSNGVVVGYAHNNSNARRAFRWTADGGMIDLGTLYHGTYSVATDVSEDGSRIVGYANEQGYLGLRLRGFCWRSDTGMDSISVFSSGYASEVLAVSPDGGWVVGWGDIYSPQAPLTRAFVIGFGITLYGQQPIPTLGGDQNEARGVSRQGSVIVGWALNHLGERHGFYMRRTSNPQAEQLYSLSVCCGEANDISPNATVIVGRSHSPQTERWHACMWLWNGSAYIPSDLRTLGGNESEAHACTDNQIVVGWSRNSAGQGRAFRWTPANGMEDLSEVYRAFLSPGSYLEGAYDISPNGRYIVGLGYNAATGREEGFLLDTACTSRNGDVDANGCVDDTDLLAVLFNFGDSGPNPADLDCNFTVDDADLLQVLFNFGSGC